MHKAAGNSLPGDTTLWRFLQTAQGMACLGLPGPALDLVGRGKVPQHQEDDEGEDGDDEEEEDGDGEGEEGEDEVVRE